ncbi:MAG: hypothetical protein LBL84_00065 [Candidatus Nomurabacteria bacterium]|jgi:uncharacterized protein (TIGR00725 family)|nr:hypothetical protein [Candidatus Nomurabacteria bacterium]
MKYQICVSGAASGDTVQQSHELAYALGKAIAESGHTLTTGATVGLPHFAAQGFMSVKDSKGVSVGFSPASSIREHIAVYRLPTKEFDYINFTGMAYVGRDVHLVRSSDAVITVGGRMGSLHELSTALEAKKVCGILTGSGGLADYTQTLFENIWAPNMDNVVYESDPEKLVKKVIRKLNERYKDFHPLANDKYLSKKRVGLG